MIIALVNLTELVAIITGMIIVFITFRAGKLTSQLYLYYLSIGFGIISLGSLLEELVSHYFKDFSIRHICNGWNPICDGHGSPPD